MLYELTLFNSDLATELTDGPLSQVTVRQRPPGSSQSTSSGRKRQTSQDILSFDVLIHPSAAANSMSSGTASAEVLARKLLEHEHYDTTNSRVELRTLQTQPSEVTQAQEESDPGASTAYWLLIVAAVVLVVSVLLLVAAIACFVQLRRVRRDSNNSPPPAAVEAPKTTTLEKPMSRRRSSRRVRKSDDQPE